MTKLTGNNNTWAPQMTSMQRERAEAPFVMKRNGLWSAFWCMVFVGFAAYVLVSL